MGPLDDSGNEYALQAHRPLLDASTLDGRDAVYGLIDVFQTSDGASVRRIDKGVYQIEATGAILRSDDPTAP